MDYSKTVCLPKTDFPMRGDLPKREPEVLDFWRKNRIYQKLLEKNKDSPLYVLHDGPPYANGHIHIGHALNKILKDMAVKSQALMGKQTPYVPGWDCHGLPIEHALLKEMKMSQKSVKDLAAFRKSAAAFAQKFIDIQREEFKRLGVLGDWENPYTTMSKEYESRILYAFRLLLKKGYIYRGLKPVYWCVHCETALAEAEIEYKDKASPSIYAAFPIVEGNRLKGKEAEVLIWTTTPWTLPANLAVTFHPELEYVLTEVQHPAWAKPRRLLLAKARLEAVLAAIHATGHMILDSWMGKDLAPESPKDTGRVNFVYECPFGGRQGIGVLGRYVTAEDGTGAVHTAPGHGMDDFLAGTHYGLKTLCPVDGAGKFTQEASNFQGLHVFKEGNPAVIENLKGRGWLLSEESIQHSYPHCWRCKNPIVFRATEQWFLNVSHGGLRQKLLKAIKETSWIPSVGESRISSMVESRPDWCLSRQRIWGTPIPILFCAQCHEPLTEDSVLEAVEKKVEKDGADFWFDEPGKNVSPADWDFLPKEAGCSKCQGQVFRRETDILDVWVDSGASWLGVQPKGSEPSDLYLEGSDQHRGWFQSSLVLSTALEGRAPYKSVLTHGFVLDEQGRAMHKSLGNVVAPQTVVEKWGADVLRLWVALSDYTEDVRLSPKLVEGPSETYRKLRNTLRYLLGNTHDFDPRHKLPYPELLEVDRFILHRLATLVQSVQGDYERYRFRFAARAVSDFCIVDLSSFYLDVLKDRLYTHPKNSRERRSAQTVLYETLTALCRLLSPLISFTAEEAWRYLRDRDAARGGTLPESVFLAAPLEVPKEWIRPELEERWKEILKVREKINLELEKKRQEGFLGSSLEAKIILSWPNSGSAKSLLEPPVDWPSVALVSQVQQFAHSPSPELEIKVERADGSKCPRCWQWKTDLGSDPSHPEVCSKCAKALRE